MDTERNLLFAVMALQVGLITSEQFAEVCSTWSLHKGKPLADHLLDRRWLSDQDRQDLDRIVARKLSQHDGDARASLASVATEGVRASLVGVEDADIRASIVGPPPPVDPDATVPYEPQTHDRFTLSRLHATGGIGQVWLARDPNLGREVALKELRPERLGQPHIGQRFLNEARLTGQLEHPGIVPVYEVGQRSESEGPFYTMRFVRGRTMTEAIRAYHARLKSGTAKPLELHELLSAFVSICNTVGYAHSRGVIHRDLKPQNIVLGEHGEVIVLDWGLARIVGEPDGDWSAIHFEGDAEAGSRTVAGQVVGTPAYMAPEQARGQLDKLNERTDVYGLGAILYQILTGRPPFLADDTASVVRAVTEQSPARPRSIVPQHPSAIEAVCLRALSKDPPDRYASARALADDVKQFLGDEPVAAYPDPWTTRTRRWIQRHRTLVAGLGAMMVTGLALSLVALGVVSREQRATQEALQTEAQRTAMLRDTLDLLSSTVIDEWLMQVVELQPEHREFLGKMLGYYEALAADLGESTEVQADLVLARITIGRIQARMGDNDSAVRSFRMAIAEADRLLSADPGNTETGFGNPELASAKAAAHHRLSSALSDVGDLDEAERELKTAREISSHLLDQDPTNLLYVYRQAIILSSTGRINYLQGAYAMAHPDLAWADQLLAWAAERDPSRTGYNRARLYNRVYWALAMRRRNADETMTRLYVTGIELAESMLAQRSDDSVRAQLATLCNDFGISFKIGNDLANAEKWYARAIVIRRNLRERYPGNLGHAGQYSASLLNRGNLLLAQGKYDEAAGVLDEAIDELTRIVEIAPDRLRPTSHLRNCCESRGEVHLALGNHPAAVADFEAAIEHNNKLDNVYFHARLPLRLELAHVRGGQAPAAVARAEQHYESVDEKAVKESSYLLAAVHAAAHQQLRSLSEEEAERSAKRSIELLDKAFELRWSKNRVTGRTIHDDPDFDPIRDREDFKELLGTLKNAGQTDPEGQP